jgi:hypothetical protein
MNEPRMSEKPPWPTQPPRIHGDGCICGVNVNNRCPVKDRKPPQSAPDARTTDGPPFTVDRYGSLGACICAENRWLRSKVAELEKGEPVAYVPIHPRIGPLWASTIESKSGDYPQHYELKPLYFAPRPALTREEGEKLVEDLTRYARYGDWSHYNVTKAATLRAMGVGDQP